MKNSIKTPITVEFEKYRIIQTEDKRNYILQELREGGINRRTGELAAPRWVDVGYYGRLDHLISSLLNRSLEIPSAASLDVQLKEILQEIKRVESDLLKAIK